MSEGASDTFESSWIPIKEEQGKDGKEAEEDCNWPYVELIFATIRNVALDGFAGHLATMK